MSANKKSYKKIALAVSLCLILVWGLLGTGASLAWFTDTSEELVNIFHVAEFDLEVYHRLDDGSYEKVESTTKLFDDEALYEPGYVQVVYLKIENNGTVPFDFKTAVNVTDYTVATNVFGQTFNLKDYLRFGIISADSEEELMQKVENRDLAKEIANMKLSNYSTEVTELEAEDTAYVALVVRMPEEVANEANYYFGSEIPKVELGVIVKADQQRN